jgi:hypothetical protein
MIFGRPTNLILGAFTAIFNVLVIAHVPYIWDPAVVAGVNIAFGAVIALIANVPAGSGPTVIAGKPAPQ